MRKLVDFREMCGVQRGSEICRQGNKLRYCKKWVHIKCGRVSNLLYGELKKAVSGTTLCLGVKFLCTKCDKIFVSLKIDIKRMMERQNEMERKQEGLAESLKVVKEEV